MLLRTYGLLLDSINQGDLEDAYALSDQLLAAEPDDPSVLYQAILLNFWREQSIEKVRALAARARGTLRPRRELALIDGVVAMADHDFATAARTFRGGLADAAGDRDLRYGLFEALWHQGFVADAVTVYLRLVADFPRCRLGDQHMLQFYADRRDPEGLRWVASGRVSRSLVDGTRTLALEGPSAAARDERFVASLKPFERALLLAMAGRPEAKAARKALDRAEFEGARPEVGRLALAIAAGDKAAVRRLVPDVEGSPGMFLWEARLALEELAALAASPRVPRRLAVYALAELRRLHPVHRPVGTDLALALLAGRLGDRGLLGSLATSPAPELAALAGALLAELQGDLVDARAKMDQALAAPSDGRFRLAEQYHRARLARAQGDVRVLREACGAVVSPHDLQVSWGSLARDCRDWLAVVRAREAR